MANPEIAQEQLMNWDCWRVDCKEPTAQATTPNTVAFSRLARLLFHLSMVAALAENLPHRSRENEFIADGFLLVHNTLSFTISDGLNEWPTGAKSSLVPETDCAIVAQLV
jgi:hypothetical protein